ncbi:hypothetical protein BSL78_23663 [Apostichopus japonicus]|uniref:J domain-containing protein n=1 Tax=Stichopus japonicus TaxID=307972 RepID=A0A2G8JUV8_STIJA|nr:hypothetical protein BSL78_23663 [Apostichopus japonicus]
MSFLLQYSPDKLGDGADKEEIEKATQLYLKLQEAWKILNDPEKKRRYDAELAAKSLRYESPSENAVDVSEMDYDSGCKGSPSKYFLREEEREMAQMLPLREGLISLVLHHKFILTRTWYNQSIVDARGSRIRPWQMITQLHPGPYSFGGGHELES